MVALTDAHGPSAWRVPSQTSPPLTLPRFPLSRSRIHKNKICASDKFSKQHLDNIAAAGAFDREFSYVVGSNLVGGCAPPRALQPLFYFAVALRVRCFVDVMCFALFWGCLAFALRVCVCVCVCCFACVCLMLSACRFLVIFMMCVVVCVCVCGLCMVAFVCRCRCFGLPVLCLRSFALRCFGLLCFCVDLLCVRDLLCFLCALLLLCGRGAIRKSGVMTHLPGPPFPARRRRR